MLRENNKKMEVRYFFILGFCWFYIKNLSNIIKIINVIKYIFEKYQVYYETQIAHKKRGK